MLKTEQVFESFQYKGATPFSHLETPQSTIWAHKNVTRRAFPILTSMNNVANNGENRTEIKEVFCVVFFT